MNAANDNALPTTFIVGRVYSTRSTCDHDCVHSFKILARTAKTVRVEVDGEVVTRRISLYEGDETFAPFGSYSMAAIISAKRVEVAS